MSEYFKPGGPTLPLRVEPGRNIVDSQNQVWLIGTRAADDYPHMGLKRSPAPANTDVFVRELVTRYNQHPQLVALISTLIREMSPPSAHAFRPADLPRIYFHLMKQMRDMGIDVAGPGGPAVLEIPPMPEYFEDHADEVEDHWQQAWLAGYNAAWAGPATTTTTTPTEETA